MTNSNWYVETHLFATHILCVEKQSSIQGIYPAETQVCFVIPMWESPEFLCGNPGFHLILVLKIRKTGGMSLCL